MENVSIVQYIHVFNESWRYNTVIADMDTDPGSSGVSTLAARETNRTRQGQRFQSETPEEGEDRLPRQRARRRDASRQRLPSRRRRAELLIELAGDDGLHQRVPSSERYASLDAALQVLSMLLRSARPVVPGKEALCNTEEH